MSITFAPNPIPIIIKQTGQEGYVLYVESSGMFENDVWTVVLCEGGEVLHVVSVDCLIHNNATFGIKKREDDLLKFVATNLTGGQK
jgi:hypothetical protein